MKQQWRTKASNVKCRNATHTGHETGRNNDDRDNETSRTSNRIVNSRETNNEASRRRPDSKNQGYVERKKNENGMRCLALNLRFFGPGQTE